MQRLINPSAEKVFVHNETSYTIKPLTRQQHEQIKYMWLELVSNESSREEASDIRKTMLTIVKYRSLIDQDKVEKILASAIIKIDHPDATDVVKYLHLLPEDDFWTVYNEIANWTSLDKETENFSVSSPEVGLAVPAEEGVQKTAAQVEGLVSDTEISSK